MSDPAANLAFASDAGPAPLPSGLLRKRASEDNRRSFLRMVSHELRTPLNSIIGFSEVITREIYGPLGDVRYREHAEIIRDSGLKLLKLVNDVVEIARLEAGDVDLDPRPENPLPALEETVRALSEEAARRSVRLIVAEPETTLSALVDSRAIRTVLNNLIQNAITHSLDGEAVEIEVRGSGQHIVYAIRDHGAGVDPEMLARIQRPFEQGQNALVRKSEGVGLGLAIANLLCQGMGGSLRLVSAPGEGMTALVRVPAVRPPRGYEALEAADAAL